MSGWTLDRFFIIGTVWLLSLLAWAIPTSWAGPPIRHARIGQHALHHRGCVNVSGNCEAGVGSWYWVRSPEQEARLVAGLYNRYCVRCHGIDGRGVWDIPDVSDFTSASWQASRSDAQLTRLILEGRGAVMPAFRGTLSLEESAALARYLRRFSESLDETSMDEVPPTRRTSRVQPNPK